MKGFTLIELIIVMAILGILLAISIPAYQEYASNKGEDGWVLKCTNKVIMLPKKVRWDGNVWRSFHYDFTFVYKPDNGEQCQLLPKPNHEVEQ